MSSGFVSKKDADQSLHLRTLIIAFVIRVFVKYHIKSCYKRNYFNFCLVSVDKETIIRLCADPGVIVRGVQVNLTKNALTTFFLVLILFY